MVKDNKNSKTNNANKKKKNQNYGLFKSGVLFEKPYITIVPVVTMVTIVTAWVIRGFHALYLTSFFAGYVVPQKDARPTKNVINCRSNIGLELNICG